MVMGKASVLHSGAAESSAVPLKLRSLRTWITPCRHLRGDEEQKLFTKDEKVQAQPMGILAAARVQGERLVAQANRSVAKWIYKIILNPSPAQIEERFAERTRYVY